MHTHASLITSPQRGFGEIWQGGIPPEGGYLRDQKVQILVLCAMEHQPPADRFPGLAVIYAPNDDDPKRAPSEGELQTARKAAMSTAVGFLAGKKVLVTCAQGRNRSGLVTAFALISIGLPVKEVLDRIRERRENALMNPQFVREIFAYADANQGMRAEGWR